MSDILIKTPRLDIRRPTLDDLDAVHAAKTAVWPELQKWMSWAYDKEAGKKATRKFIEDSLTSEANCALFAFDKQNRQFAVASGLHHSPGGYITGYWVAPDYLGKGYATEAANAVIRYAFQKLKVKCVLIDYYEGNDKSRRVIEKLGFEKMGVAAKSKKRCSNGELLDVHYFSMHNPDNLPALEIEIL